MSNLYDEYKKVLLKYSSIKDFSNKILGKKIIFLLFRVYFVKKCLNDFLPSVEAPEGNNALCDKNRGTAVNQDLNL